MKISTLYSVGDTVWFLDDHKTIRKGRVTEVHVTASEVKRSGLAAMETWYRVANRAIDSAHLDEDKLYGNREAAATERKRIMALPPIVINLPPGITMAAPQPRGREVKPRAKAEGRIFDLTRTPGTVFGPRNPTQFKP